MAKVMDILLPKDEKWGEELVTLFKEMKVGEEKKLDGLFPGLGEPSVLTCVEDTPELRLFDLYWCSVVVGKFRLVLDAKGGEVIMREVTP